MSEGGNNGGEGGAGGGNGGGGGGGGGGQTVPYARFQTVVSEKNTMAARIATLEGELQGASEKAATVDTLSRSLDEWKGKAESADGRFKRYREISGTLGQTDPDVVELVEFQYGKLDKEKRPELTAWLKDLKKDPTKAPSTLRHFLQDAGGGDGGEGGKKKPNGTGGGTQPGGTTGGVTAEQIAEARKHGVKTGDWSKYKALKKQMKGSD